MTKKPRKEIYAHSHGAVYSQLPTRELVSVCLRARARRQIFRNTHVAKADVCDARKEINADRPRLRTGKIAQSSQTENLYYFVCIANLIFSPLLSSRCDYYIESR